MTPPRLPDAPTASVPAAATGAGTSARLASLLARMTRAEKIGQLVQRPGGRSKALNSLLGPKELDAVRQGRVGSYLHVAGAEALRELQRVAVEESRLGVPLLFAMDVIHGYRTIFPVPLGLAASFDPELVEATARCAAREATAVGLHWTFAPMVDVSRDPRWGRVVEGAGEDPYLGSVLAAATVRGFQGEHLSSPDALAACPKHFVAYGAATGGRDYDSAEVSPRALDELYFPPFRAALAAGAMTVMSAFNDVAGVPATASAGLLTEILRERWGFGGVVVSDWNAIPELIAHGVAADRATAAGLALTAGVDIDMAGEAYAEHLDTLVAGGSIPERALDAAVRRVLALKEALGLFDAPYGRGDTASEDQRLLAPEHRALARAAARASFVLLRNEERTLPFAPTPRRLAVLGPLADDAGALLGCWRAQGRPEEATSIVAGLRAALADALVVHEPGVASANTPSATVVAAAVEAARAADAIVLVLGEDADQTGEARSQSRLELPDDQLELAQAILSLGRPTAVVLLGGRPLAVPWLAEHAPALVQAWLPGTEGGHALADVLLGREDFSGRLPMTVPRATGQVPVFYAHRSTGRPASEDLSVDTTRYRDLPTTPLFPFGHGLSTTTFAYSALRISQGEAGIEVTCEVTNSGPRAGIEVVQVYVSDRVARVARPVRELRAFARVRLTPAEAATITFTLPLEAFAYPDAGGQPTLEAGDFELCVGRSAAELRLRGYLTLAAPDHPLGDAGTVFSSVRVTVRRPGLE